MIIGNKIIKKIVHISDVHIRKNRHDEYRDVFKKLYKKISEYDTTSLLIVITGDIFHEGINAENIILCRDFYSTLCEYTDVISIIGNHDLSSRTNENKMDYLTSALHKLETKNKIHHLIQSGVYIYGNISFGLTTMFDNKITSINTENKIKIGLYHGIINGCKTSDEFQMFNTGNFNVSDFNEYDYVLLGDIHHFQYLNSKKTIWYASSILQNSFGEEILNHGFVLLDLIKKTSEHIHIKNDYGFLTIKIKNNKIEKYVENIPKNLNLKIQYEDTSDDFIVKTYAKFQAKYNIINYVSEKIQKEYKYLDKKIEEQKESDNNGTTINRLLEYIKENTKYTEEEQKEIKIKLENTMKDLDFDYNKTKKIIKLKTLQFDNFNSYGKDNSVNFDLFKNKIVNLNGKNGIGKSSLILAIIYSIWGITEDSSISRYDYINNKTDTMQSTIILDVNNKEYKIVRTATKLKKNNHSVILYENNIDISGKDLISIQNQILDIVGKPEEIINLCIMSQKNTSSFVQLSNEEKKNFICKILKLDVYNKICDVISTEQNIITREINSLNLNLYGDKKKIQNKYDLEKKELEVLNQDLNVILQKENETNNQYQVLYEEILKLKFNCDNIVCDENIKNISKKIKEEEIEYKKNLILLETKEKEIKIYKQEHDKKNITDQINKLRMSYTNLTETIDIEQKNNLEIEIKKIKQELENIEKEMKDNVEEKYFDEFVLYEKQYNEILEKEKYSEKSKKEFNQKDLDKMEKTSEILKNKIENYNKEIILLENKKVTIEYDSDTEEDEKTYCKYLDEKIKHEEILSKEKKELKQKEKYLDLLKSHEYNPECDICMKNKTTTELLDIKESINLSINVILKKEKINKKINKKYLIYEKIHKKYAELKEQEQQNILLDNEILELQRKKEMENINLISNEIQRKILLKNKGEYEKHKEEYEEIKKTKESMSKKYNELKFLAEKYKKMQKLERWKQEQTKNFEINNLKMEKIKKNMDSHIENEKIKCEIFKLDEILENIVKHECNIAIVKELRQTLENNKNKINQLEKLMLNFEMKTKYEEEKKEKKILFEDITCEKKIIEKNKNMKIEVIAQKEQEIKSMEEHKKTIERKNKIYECNEKIINSIRCGFMDNLMSNHIIPKLCKDLNSILNYYVDFKVHMIYEEKKIIVYKKDLDGNLVHIMKTSGYQSLMVNIAMRILINSVNKTIKTNFYIMDEILSFADNENIGKIKNLFEYMQKLYDCVIVISHDDNIKDFCNYNAIITQNSGFSKIKIM